MKTRSDETGWEDQEEPRDRWDENKEMRRNPGSDRIRIWNNGTMMQR